MLVEVNRYWRRNENCVGIKDNEASAPKHDVSDDRVSSMMDLLSNMGYKCIEFRNSTVFTKRINCHELEEVIFYKA